MGPNQHAPNPVGMSKKLMMRDTAPNPGGDSITLRRNWIESHLSRRLSKPSVSYWRYDFTWPLG